MTTYFSMPEFIIVGISLFLFIYLLVKFVKLINEKDGAK